MSFCLSCFPGFFILFHLQSVRTLFPAYFLIFLIFKELLCLFSPISHFLILPISAAFFIFPVSTYNTYRGNTLFSTTYCPIWRLSSYDSAYEFYFHCFILQYFFIFSSYFLFSYSKYYALISMFLCPYRRFSLEDKWLTWEDTLEEA